MASQGPNAPLTCVSTSTGAPGSATWSTPVGADESDDTYANLFFGSSGTQISAFLKVTNFGFSIPSGATIDGIVVEIERQDIYGSVNATTKDHTVQLYKGGTNQGTNKADTSTAWSAETFVTYGSSSDLWGLSFSDTDINDSGFGVGLAVTQNILAKGPSTGAEVDLIQITVYYTASGGGGTQTALLVAGD